MYSSDKLEKFAMTFHENKREKLLNTFISSFRGKYEMCVKAEKENNIEVLQAAMHDLKTLSYTIGHTELGDIAKKTELSAIGKLHDKAFSEVKDIYPLIDGIINTIGDYLKSVSKK